MANYQVLKSVIFFIKFLELSLGITCVALTANEYVSTQFEKMEVIHATYYGFFFVSAVVVISFIADTPVHPKLVMVVSGVATVMYITTGAFHIDTYNWLQKDNQNFGNFTLYTFDLGFNDKKLLAAGILSIVTGIVYAADVFLSWKQL